MAIMTLRVAAALGSAMLCLAVIARGQERMPEFGPDGLAGLDQGQKAELVRGHAVLPEGAVKTTNGTSFIEAALVFDRPPAEVWSLLSKTELQVHYVPEIKAANLIWDKGNENCLELNVRVMGRNVVYRMIQSFDPPQLYFHWVLDAEMPSDIKELAGFWRFYPYGQDRTLARYGSIVKPRFPVPGFLRRAIAKGHVRSDLESVKKYVDSGGTWRAADKKH
jgi:hypothetical protein